ncbi:hypothetical protein N6H05_25830 (plasmid) [Sphingobium sp. WTD-1]|jgi:putative SOS response-associated peptidase YedK|uniref:Uncharacterized protein n=1 Tax=Sphingobium yanoikuyae TaxID=13690 RepID=A0A3G2USI9_SPHYA|nr:MULTISPECIES: hypothetical protein [Sphingobium]AYO75869.1 hypothetical protein EBF16_02610 [Sphingobium yanoikuyae]QNG49349.1 hypothetical protein H3V42_31260 [Sphingobium yanoikuyae]WIA59132.1 hypothetical protein N6H05_25830 [Sphingobium sp. WTD-1]
MTSQLSLFDAKDYDFLAPIEETLPKQCAAAQGLIGFEQNSMRAVLPRRYLHGLDLAPRAVRPFGRALVLYGTGEDFVCVEMSWGLPGEGVPLLLARGGLWPAFGHGVHEQRCVVVADSILLAPGVDAASLRARVQAADDEPLYLGGLCRMTADGAAFSLIERPTTRSLRQAGSTAPMLIEEQHVWSWLNSRLAALRPDLRRMHRRCSISLMPESKS